VRSFWVRPIASLFFAAVLIAGLWHGNRSAAETLTRFDPPAMRRAVAAEHWWNQAWMELPTRRNEFRDRNAWPLNLQYAGSLSSLRQRLERRGWTVAAAAGWDSLLRSLDKAADAETLPVLPAAHNGHGDALLMSRRVAGEDVREVLYLWPAPLRLTPGDVPVWQGTVARMRLERRLDLFSLWQIESDQSAARAPLRRDLRGFRVQDVRRDHGGPTVLLVRDAVGSRTERD
jgi:hypothetical protein